MITVGFTNLANAAVYDERLHLTAILVPIAVLLMIIIYVVRRRSGRRQSLR